jgi:hypothetical protein
MLQHWASNLGCSWELLAQQHGIKISEDIIFSSTAARTTDLTPESLMFC